MLGVVALIWLFPYLWMGVTSLKPLDDGHMTVSSAPGLGVRVDFDRLPEQSKCPSSLPRPPRERSSSSGGVHAAAIAQQR